MIAMNTCDTCKWWGIDEGDLTRRCSSKLFEADPGKENERSVVQNGSDAGYVWLTTGPKFGCIHWESK